MYILEGNMGVGKTTFLKLLSQKYPHIHTHREPEENWTSSSTGKSLLESYFQNPRRWAYTVETFITACRVKEHLHLQQNTNPYFIVERSLYAGYYCFAQLEKEEALFTPAEWKLYNQWVDFLIADKCKPPRGFIYLQATPEICYTRVKKRNRKSERHTPFSFIEKLHTLHERFLITEKNTLKHVKNIPVLVLDANKDFCLNSEIFDQHAQKIDAFITQIQSRVCTQNSALL